MMLGAYTFEWLPDKMTIPRPGKTVAIAKNLGGAAYLSWPPTVNGERVKMEWEWMPISQYNALRAIYLAGTIVAWDLPSGDSMVPTGTAEVAYDVKILSLEAKFFDTVDYDMSYRKEVEMILLVRE